MKSSFAKRFCQLLLAVSILCVPVVQASYELGQPNIESMMLSIGQIAPNYLDDFKPIAK